MEWGSCVTHHACECHEQKLRKLEQENAELQSHVEALEVALKASGERREAAEQESAELKQQLELMATSKGSAWYSEVVRLEQETAELQERVGRLQASAQAKQGGAKRTPRREAELEEEA